jgi:TRAP-type C4-dicarboxylate transport system permease small subunit
MQHDQDEPLTIVDRATLAMSRVAMFLVAFVVAIITYEVVMRYFFLRPTLWVNELSLWVGGMIYLLAGIYTMQRRAHIRITALYDHVPRNLQRAFDLIAVLCIVAFATGVVVGGFESAWRSMSTFERYGTAWDPPIPAVMKPLILVVVIVVAIQAINNFLVDVKKDKPTLGNQTRID